MTVQKFWQQITRREFNLEKEEIDVAPLFSNQFYNYPFFSISLNPYNLCSKQIHKTYLNNSLPTILKHS